MNDESRAGYSGEHEPYHNDAPLSAWLSAAGERSDTPKRIRIDAQAIADAQIGVIEHASLVIQQIGNSVEVCYAGPTVALPDELNASQTPVLTLHDQVVLPALANAHTHLDLTHIGPRPHQPGDGFVAWVDMIRSNRATHDNDIAHCVRLGIKKTLAGGVIAVGDIAGAPAGRLTDAPARTLAKSPLIGVSYLEFFGIGTSAAAAVRRVSEYLENHSPQLMDELVAHGVRLGWQPHAPNTVDLGVYRWITQAAAVRGMPLSTHLAESPEEREFIAQGTGPQRSMLERFGIWDESALEYIAKGKHPIEHLCPVLSTHPYLVAHVNDTDDDGIQTLAQSGTSVAYCPRASRYFDAPTHFGPHRYRDMLEAGVNVCLGTDSIVNLDTPDRISTLDDMRLLYRDGDHDPVRLLAMGTTNTARALGLDPDRFTLASGRCPLGLISIPTHFKGENRGVWDSLMRSDTAPSWLYLE